MNAIFSIVIFIFMGLLLVGIPIGFIFLIYVLIKNLMQYNAELKGQEKTVQTDASKKPFTQADFERWKQNKGGFVDLDAPIILPWRRTA